MLQWYGLQQTLSGDAPHQGMRLSSQWWRSWGQRQSRQQSTCGASEASATASGTQALPLRPRLRTASSMSSSWGSRIRLSVASTALRWAHSSSAQTASYSSQPTSLARSSQRRFTNLHRLLVNMKVHHSAHWSELAVAYKHSPTALRCSWSRSRGDQPSRPAQGRPPPHAGGGCLAERLDGKGPAPGQQRIHGPGARRARSAHAPTRDTPAADGITAARTDEDTTADAASSLNSPTALLRGHLSTARPPTAGKQQPGLSLHASTKALCASPPARLPCRSSSPPDARALSVPDGRTWKWCRGQSTVFLSRRLQLAPRRHGAVAPRFGPFGFRRLYLRQLSRASYAS